MEPPYSDTVWTRLEPVSRDGEMTEGLRAELRDPMWLLTRQWQLGELDGEDAGSPVHVVADLAFDRLSRYQAVGEGPPATPEPYTGGPLEATVERETVLTGERQPDARLAVQGGRTFLRLLRRREPFGDGLGPDDVPEGYVLADVPADEDEPVGDAGRRFTAFVTGRVLDGHTVFLAVDAAVNAGTWDAESLSFPWDDDAEWDGPSELPVPGDHSATDEAFRSAAIEYHEWYGSLYEEPETTADSAWDPQRMEYRFRVATGGPNTEEGDTETVLAAGEYPGGRLDWSAFSPLAESGNSGDVTPLGLRSHDPSEDADAGSLFDEDGDESSEDADANGGGGETTTRTKHVLPTEASFKGMPSPRYWEFEDADVRLDEVSADEVSSQTLVNFALVYGNDWFTFPVDTPLGSLARITGLTVEDTFGIEQEVPPLREDGWNMYMVDSLPRHDEPGLFVPPVLDDVTESDPVERVSFARDEMANLAFAAEQVVEDPTGQPLARDEYVRPTLLVEDVSPDTDVDEESVRLRNPGREPLDVGGWLVTDGSTTFAFGADETIAAETTVTLHSGSEPAGEHAETDYYWGASDPVWYGSGEDTAVLSVYEPCDVDEHDHQVTPATVTAADPPLDHLRVRERVPLREVRDRPAARYALATDLYDHWFALRPSAEQYVADVPDDASPGDLMQYRYRHFLELALVLDAETLDASTIAELPDPEGEILRPYPDDDGRSLRVYNEELLAAGREVTRRYQRATWTDGAAYLWSGRRSTPGTDDVGSSTLRFDVLENWPGDGTG